MQVGSTPDEKKKEIEWVTRGLNVHVKRAVLSGLAHFAPQRSLEVIVAILEQEYSVDFERLAENTGTLKFAFTRMFGGGAPVVEIRISKELARDMGVEFDGRSLDELIIMLRAANETLAPAH